MLCSGFMVGGAFAAFYSALGVFSKIFHVSTLKKGYKLFVICMGAGIVFGSAASIYNISLDNTTWFAYAFLLFGGTFIGVYIALLAEILKTIAVLSGLGFSKALLFIAIMTVAVGKLAGSLVYFIIPYFR